MGRNSYVRCQHCARWYLVASAKKYCTPACRQAAYRRRHDSGCGARERRRAGARQAVATRAASVQDYTCEACGGVFVRTGLESARRYCSAACKQRAYRQRVTTRASNGRVDRLPDELQPIVVGQKRMFRGREVEVTALVGDEILPRKIRIRSEKDGCRVTSWLTTYAARLDFCKSRIVSSPMWRSE